MADLFSLANSCRFAAADNRPEQMRSTLSLVARELAVMTGPAPALVPCPAPRNPLDDGYSSATDIPKPPKSVPVVSSWECAAGPEIAAKFGPVDRMVSFRCSRLTITVIVALGLSVLFIAASIYLHK